MDLPGLSTFNADEIRPETMTGGFRSLGSRDLGDLGL
jgi:hypothetical protein